MGAELGNLGLTGREQRQLVAFMLAMTDEHVRSLLPAVGATGLAASGAGCRPNSGELFTEFAHLSRMR